MRPKAFWRGATLALVAGFVGCTLVVRPDAAQCSSDRDCERFVWTTCVQGGCIPREASAPPPPDPNAPCTSTQDCSAIHPEGFSVCQRGQCNALKSGDCGTVIGDYTADDVLILGAMLPLYGDAHKSTGTPMSRALALAGQEDFAGGLPFGDGKTNHPVAIVLCDEVQDPVRAAHHLIDLLGVPAILGPSTGAALISVAVQVALPKGVILVSPYATADLSTIGAGGYVWRTAPDSRYEGAAMAALVPAVLEPKARASNGGAPIRVASLTKRDQDNLGLLTHVEASLRFNGAGVDANGALYTSVFYKDPDRPGTPDSAAAVSAIVQAAPDVVLVAGNSEAVALLATIEDDWIAPRRPLYLLSHGLEVEELLTLVASRPGLASNIVVTSPGAARTDAVAGTLKARYNARDYPFQTFGVAQTYDAFYLLAYALAAVRNVDVNGHDVHDGLLKSLGFADGGAPASVTVNAGPSQIPATIAAIRAGSAIRLHGAAGEYDFDPSSGSSPSGVQTACIVDNHGLEFHVVDPNDQSDGGASCLH